jgi:hypothetical protein
MRPARARLLQGGGITWVSRLQKDKITVTARMLAANIFLVAWAHIRVSALGSLLPSRA